MLVSSRAARVAFLGRKRLLRDSQSLAAPAAFRTMQHPPSNPAAAAAPAGPTTAAGAAVAAPDTPWRVPHAHGHARPPLAADTTADVVVVGAGVSGLSLALECIKLNLSVAVLESRTVGAGMSGRSTGIVTEWPGGAPGGLAAVEARHGFAAARELVAARRAAFDWVKNTVEEERIECGWREAAPCIVPEWAAGAAADGGGSTSHQQQRQQQQRAVAEELDACSRAGLATAAAAAAQQSSSSPSPLRPPAGAVQAPGRAAVIDPEAYARGLAAAVERRGGVIYEGTRALSGPFTISGRVATLAADNASRGPVAHAARGAVLATNSPCNRSLAVHGRQVAWRTYHLAFEVPGDVDLEEASLLGAAAATGGGGCALLGLDGASAARLAVRSSDGARLLIVSGGGGSDHVAGQARERFEEREPYAALEAWARASFPRAAAGRAAHRWSAVVFRPVDLLALYGDNPLDVGDPATRVVTGHGTDVVMGAATAALALAPGLAKGGAGAGAGAAAAAAAPEWARLFSPARVRPLFGSLGSLGALATLAGANLRGYGRVLAPTCARDLVGLFAPGAVERGILPGDGQVVQEGLRKVALFRDADGTLHRRSALCPHMHVLLSYNPSTRTFDCPGHGSVFGVDGTCLNGPAARDLEDLGWRREAEGRGAGGGGLTK